MVNFCLIKGSRVPPIAYLRLHRRPLGQAGWVTHLVIGGGALLLVGGHTPGSDHLGHQGREGGGQAMCSEGLVTRYSAQTDTDQEQETGGVILNN